MIFAINGCSVDTERYELRRGGALVPVEPQVFDLLVLLLEKRDRVVTKEELVAHIWHGRAISDAALSSRIKTARQAIGDDGASQSCIRTVRGRGFRVVAEVGVHGGGDEAGPEQNTREDGGRGRPRFWAGGHVRAAGLAAAVALVAGAAILSWRVIGPQSGIGGPIEAALGMPAGPGIAVLPFDSISADSSLHLFGRAITEEITTALTRFSELRVAGRGAVLDHADTETDIREAARKMGVEYLVQGSLRRSGERIRVTARLLRGSDGSMLWAETYERHLTPADLFAVQEDIASKVVAAVASISAGAIARETLGQARGKPPRDLSAYECTIRANELMTSGFSESTHLATRTCLEAVVDKEPDYAAAWAMLSWTHSYEFTQGLNRRPWTDPRKLALKAARMSVELAPANPLGRFAMARATYLMGDLDAFYAEVAKGLSLNPHEPFLLGNFGSWLAFTGRWEEGVALIRKAIALNPKVYPRWWHAALGKNYYRQGAYQEALIEFKNMDLPNWWWNQVEFAYTYGQLGDKANAERAVAKLYELYPGFDLEKAAMEHRKFSFEQSYIDLAIDGLRKAGVPEKALAQR